MSVTEYSKNHHGISTVEQIFRVSATTPDKDWPTGLSQIIATYNYNYRPAASAWYIPQGWDADYEWFFVFSYFVAYQCYS